jgi:hypothetical protein
LNTVAAGNVFENNYQDGQTGEAILLKSTGDGGCKVCAVANLDFRNNKILNTRASFSVINLQTDFPQAPPPIATHIRFYNNFWQERDGRGSLSQGANYFELNHNTFVSKGPKSSFIYYIFGGNGTDIIYPQGYKAPGYKLINNIAFGSEYGLIGDGRAPGESTLSTFLAADRDVRQNIIPYAGGNYPGRNFYPQNLLNDEYVNFAAGDFSLKSSSVYKGKATDGKDIGVDWAVLEQALQIARSGAWGGAGTSRPSPTLNVKPAPTSTATPRQML